MSGAPGVEEAPVRFWPAARRLLSLLRPFRLRMLGAVAATCAFVAWWGATVTFTSFRANAVIENVLQTPQWMVYICIPLGFALTAIEFARKGVRAAWNGG